MGKRKLRTRRAARLDGIPPLTRPAYFSSASVQTARCSVLLGAAGLPHALMKLSTAPNSSASASVTTRAAISFGAGRSDR